MSTRITLVRHGTTEWMEKGLTHGRMDAPLSPLGVAQVNASAELLRGRKFDDFFASPTGRAWQSAGIVSQVVGLSPKPLDLLMERDFGNAEGKAGRHFSRTIYVIRSIIDWFIPLSKDAEPLKQVDQRAKKVLDLVVTNFADKSILLVSHYGMVSMILREITGKKFAFFHISPASITEIEVDENKKGKILSISNSPVQSDIF